MNKKPERKKEDSNPEHKDWTLEQEELLAEWAEKAACYRWLHNKSEKYYRVRNYAFTIPVIILSTLTGTANFAMDSFVPTEQKKMAMGIVGGVNIFAGILSTLQNFLRYAELMESHRSISVSWSKFARNISVELALDTKRRKHAGDFLKICRAEFDRLIEQAPSIDESIIKEFNTHFKNTDIIRPEVCNGLHKCKIYKPTKDEKIADVIATAGGKFLDKRKEHLKSARSWKKVELQKKAKDILHPEMKRDSVESRKSVNESDTIKSEKELIKSEKELIRSEKELIKSEKELLNSENDIKIDIIDLPEKSKEDKPNDNKDKDLDEFIDGIEPGQENDNNNDNDNNDNNNDNDIDQSLNLNKCI